MKLCSLVDGGLFSFMFVHNVAPITMQDDGIQIYRFWYEVTTFDLLLLHTCTLLYLLWAKQMHVVT